MIKDFLYLAVGGVLMVNQTEESLPPGMKSNMLRCETLGFL